MAPRLLLAITLVLFSVPVNAQGLPERPNGWLTGAYIGFAVGQALDVQSTSLALGRGARETNAFMRPCVGSSACSSAVKAATTAAVFWMVERRIRPHSKPAAIATMMALTAAQSYIVVQNYRVAHQLGRR
jgi:hypothetical protein